LPWDNGDMSDHDADVAHHADQHDAEHDAHAHHEGSLGPVDWRMWIAGVLGVVAALVSVAGFVAATNFRFSA
jgi:ABC-type Zn2+ transport system substrate-binding protein/surface adhesin